MILSESKLKARLNRPACTLPHCQLVKRVLIHMLSCKDETKCTGSIFCYFFVPELPSSSSFRQENEADKSLYRISLQISAAFRVAKSYFIGDTVFGWIAGWATACVFVEQRKIVLDQARVHNDLGLCFTAMMFRLEIIKYFDTSCSLNSYNILYSEHPLWMEMCQRMSPEVTVF